MRFIALFLLFGTVDALADDLRAVYDRAAQSVVALKISDALDYEISQGTGFVVTGGLIVTNHHVVEGASRILAVGPHTEFYIASILVEDPRQDIAILKAVSHRLPALSLASSPPAIGSRVVVLGNPLGLAGTLSEGVVSAYRADGIDTAPREHDDTPRIQISAPISPGSSGSPVMDSEGNVIGVAVSGFRHAQNLNFAVPIDAVRLILRGAKPESPLRALAAKPPRNTLLRNLSVSAALFGALFFIAVRSRSKGPRQPAPAVRFPQR